MRSFNFMPSGSAKGAGIQFHSRFKVGMAKVNMMLDSGSGVNSTTEEEVLHLINLHSQAGISMSNPKHPIRRLEKWTHTETLSGIAAGEPIKLIGAVVLRVKFLEVGRDQGQTVNIRFKITPKGSTGWVKWIIGARALDCDERGGLGFAPQADSYFWSKLGISTDKAVAATANSRTWCAIRFYVGAVDD